MNRALKKRIEELVKEEVVITPYNPDWPRVFEEEKSNLQKILPKKIIKRIEHFGSTAISGLSAKPIIDILVEVSSLEETKKQIVPILEKKGYEYFWRPTIGNKPPYYAWFIKRDTMGKRTHHLHMVEANSELWDRLYFRDYLREFPNKAREYSDLKERLSKKYPNNRTAYTKNKTKFILATTEEAKKYYTD
jgi:GrpB-like predicted nucleotidyltransferase (UPF0157 family)